MSPLTVTLAPGPNVNNEEPGSAEPSSSSKESDKFSSDGAASATSAGQKGQPGGIGSLVPKGGYTAPNLGQDTIQGDLGPVENARERGGSGGGHSH